MSHRRNIPHPAILLPAHVGFREKNLLINPVSMAGGFDQIWASSGHHGQFTLTVSRKSETINKGQEGWIFLPGGFCFCYCDQPGISLTQNNYFADEQAYKVWSQFLPSFLHSSNTQKCTQHCNGWRKCYLEPPQQFCHEIFTSKRISNYSCQSWCSR